MSRKFKNSKIKNSRCRFARLRMHSRNPFIFFAADSLFNNQPKERRNNGTMLALLQSSATREAVSNTEMVGLVLSMIVVVNAVVSSFLNRPGFLPSGLSNLVVVEGYRNEVGPTDRWTCHHQEEDIAVSSSSSWVNTINTNRTLDC